MGFKKVEKIKPCLGTFYYCLSILKTFKYTRKLNNSGGLFLIYLFLDSFEKIEQSLEIPRHVREISFHELYDIYIGEMLLIPYRFVCIELLIIQREMDRMKVLIQKPIIILLKQQ